MSAILEVKARRVIELMPTAEVKAISPAAIIELLRLIVAAHACFTNDPDRAAAGCRSPSWLSRRRVRKIAARLFGERSPGLVLAILEMGREVTTEDLATLTTGQP